MMAQIVLLFNIDIDGFKGEIDIHGGGRDLLFPHHENEIAQTESLTGKEFAHYWSHCGLIKINGEKKESSAYLKDHRDAVEVMVDELLKNKVIESMINNVEIKKRNTGLKYKLVNN